MQQGHAAHGLALLDLWRSTQGSSSQVLDGVDIEQWRTRLMSQCLPTIPRHEASGGRTYQWPGSLVSNVYKDRTPLHVEDTFLRSHQDRLTLHEGPEYTPAWTAYLSHREAAILYQDDNVIIIQISHLGKPSQLASLSAADGTILWELDLPGELFETRESAKKIDDQEMFEALTSSGWIAIESIGDTIVLLHQDGRSAAITAGAGDDADSRILWQSSLPGHVIRDWTPWQHGVATIGYSHEAAGNEWLEEQPRSGDFILAWFDAETGNVKQSDIPVELGIPLWLRSNSLGDLVVGGSKGVGLFRRPGQLPEWISLDRSLQAMRIRDGVLMTPQVLLVTDLQYQMHSISLETGRELELEDSPLPNLMTGMPRLYASGDRIWMLYDKELQILDTQGRQIGSDAISRTQHHTFDAIAPFVDGLILIDQISPHGNRRMPSRMAGPSRPYRLQVLEPGGRSVETIDLFDLDSKIRAATAVDGMMLLSTDDQILAVQLPPELEESDP